MKRPLSAVSWVCGRHWQIQPTPLPTDQAQEVMLFALLDLAEFIDDYLPDGWDDDLAGGNLGGRDFTADANWDEALQTVLAHRAAILSGDITTLIFITPQITAVNIGANIAAAIDDLAILNASHDDAGAGRLVKETAARLPVSPVPAR
ncbi:MAG: hypothetical protein M5U34_05260 [Chloroflexi bacterium]|nr:hypothetical protein [Chloroflexota bacterium]